MQVCNGGSCCPGDAPRGVEGGKMGPAAKLLMAEHGLAPSDVSATGPQGMITKGAHAIACYVPYAVFDSACGKKWCHRVKVKVLNGVV